MNIPRKFCPSCKLEYPPTLEYFGRDSRTKTGLDSYCKVCKRTKRKKYEQEHPDKICAKRRRHKRSNPEQTRRHNKLYFQRHPDKKREYKRIYYSRNKVREAKKRREWNQLHPGYAAIASRKYRANHPERERDKARKYRQSHKEVGNASASRRRARINSVPDTFTVTEWKFARDYFDGRCAYCGHVPEPGQTLALDHFYPLRKGGANSADNVVPACHGTGGCNNSKHDRDPHTWIAARFGSEAANVEARIAAYFARVTRKIDG